MEVGEIIFLTIWSTVMIVIIFYLIKDNPGRALIRIGAIIFGIFKAFEKGWF